LSSVVLWVVLVSVSCHSGIVESRVFFFFNDTATTAIYTLSLHDALPISRRRAVAGAARVPHAGPRRLPGPRGALRAAGVRGARRSEEHTSELQSRENLVCRLLLEKKKKNSLPSDKRMSK